MIIIKKLEKKFLDQAKNSQIIFRNSEFEMGNNRTVALTGRSGSGKSTLLGILAGMDIDYLGEYHFKQRELIKTDKEMAKFRMENIGIVTQEHKLLYDRTVFENIALPLRLRKVENKTINKEVDATLKAIGMYDKKNRYSYQLSGGECQRVAIGRAIIGNPLILLADELTGSLDEESENDILELLNKLKQKGQYIIIATHSKKVSKFCDGEYHINDKKIEIMR